VSATLSRRQASLLGLTALAAGCASGADLISFDRGEFALTYAELYTFGQSLLATAIARNTKAGVLNSYAQGLKAFADRLTAMDERVRRAIIEAPQKAKDAHAVALGDLADILSKALPLILPLIAAAAAV
jgi:hypothetical protein